MYYRLCDDYALRAWKFVNHAMYCRCAPAPLRVDAETFELLLACDGEHDLEESDALKSLTERGVIAPCEQGERPSEWSRYRRYPHRMVPGMNLMLTGKCNYNCRHCFNAAENAERMAEWDYGALLDLFDQMAECGFHSVTLTGGEPMLHPRFADIVRAIYERNMVLEKLTTNGFFLHQDTLDLFRELKADPQIKISFDGVGHHDWMRGHKGAEEDAKRAFRLCAENGFRTLAQTQVYRGNLDAMRETLLTLEDAGVTSTRIIRTTETRRWLKNAPDGSLPVEEYFEKMLGLADWYMHGEHKMDVVIWRFLDLYPRAKAYDMVMERHTDGVDRPTEPVCVGNRTMMAVTCEGDVAPCLQMCGELTPFDYHFDNLKERKLADILQEGKWLGAVCTNLCALREKNAECDKCEWFGRCAGGCRALAMLHGVEQGLGPDYYGIDPLACLFYKGGWYERIQERLGDFMKI
ncbi:MAG: radical SAM protein [Ruminococcaceae bacterium]|jgi:radical SAM protein with 4Fe4S-binding SPASM domain|nr:radical SAM protein [Oscillospiraceae bacterium]